MKRRAFAPLGGSCVSLLNLWLMTGLSLGFYVAGTRLAMITSGFALLGSATGLMAVSRGSARGIIITAYVFNVIAVIFGVLIVVAVIQEALGNFVRLTTILAGVCAVLAFATILSLARREDASEPM